MAESATTIKSMVTITVKDKQSETCDRWVDGKWFHSSITYDNQGKGLPIIKSFDEGGNEIYQYNENGQPIHIIYGDTTDEFIEYDERGNEIHRYFKRPNGEIYREEWSEYDEKNRLVLFKSDISECKTVYNDKGDIVDYIEIRDGDTYVTHTDFNDNGDPISIRTKKNGELETGSLIVYQYDEKNRLIKYIGNNLIITYKHYDDGSYEETNIVNPNNPDTVSVCKYLHYSDGAIKEYLGPDGIIEKYEYTDDTHNKTSRRILIKTDGTEQEAKNEYDQNGNIISETLLNGVTTSYKYDDKDREIYWSDTEGNYGVRIYEEIGSKEIIITATNNRFSLSSVLGILNSEEDDE